MSRYYGEASGVTLLAVTGSSVERITPEDLRVADVHAAALWGVHWVTPRVGVTYGLSFHRQADAYDRRRGQVGVRLRP